MTEYHVGDEIEVTIKGPISYIYPASGNVDVMVGSEEVYAHVTTPGVEVKVTKPALPENWPPQSGDVWRSTDYHTTFFVYDNGLLMCSTGVSGKVSNLRPHNWKLEYRPAR
jgi:hypothetical protein